MSFYTPSLEWAKTNLRSCLGFRSDDPVPLACVRMCPMLVMPVCGYNGKEYRIFGNSCLFGIENCLLQGGKVNIFFHGIEMYVKTKLFSVGEYENVPMEECTLSESIEPQSDCSQIVCDIVYDPVCGFDGHDHKIFGNKCMMGVYSCQRSESK